MSSKSETKATLEVIVARRLAKTFTSANNRGKDFNLTFEYMKNILAQTHCAYSGEKFTQETGPDSMTLERWNNDKGYVLGNVIPVKDKYNNLKANLSIEQMAKASGQLLKECDIIKNTPPNNNMSPKALQLHNEIQNMQKNIKRRKEVLLERTDPVYGLMPTPEVQALLKRIEQGEAQVANSLVRLNKLKKQEHTPDLNKSVKTNENAIHGYDIIVQALQRLNAMSVVDYLNLKKGLPITKRG